MRAGFKSRQSLSCNLQRNVSITQELLGLWQFPLLRFQFTAQDSQGAIPCGDVVVQSCKTARIRRFQRLPFLTKALRSLRELVEQVLRVPELGTLDLEHLIGLRERTLQLIVTVTTGPKCLFRER